jgi:Ca2+-binding EF-hand superfamily protein
MINEISDSDDFTISFEQFRAMRVLNKPCELNVLAEFKKYDIHKLQRGIVTKDCVRKVLRAELIELKYDAATFNQELDRRMAHIMAYDSDGDGIITFKDFYDNILRRVP